MNIDLVDKLTGIVTKLQESQGENRSGLQYEYHTAITAVLKRLAKEVSADGLVVEPSPF